MLPEFGAARYEWKTGKEKNAERYWEKKSTATQGT